tara:strand:+ start:47554 stop:48219 length:666 start_codon:yes stop_codon:yes gene_type:complete
MARKPLLTEAEIRSFMKLADLAPIGDVKLQEMGYGSEEEETVAEEEEELELDVPMGDVEDEPAPAMDAPEAPVDDMDMGDDLGMDDLGDAGDDMGEGDTEEQFMDLVQQLADLVGVDVAMDADAEEAADELEMGDDVESLEGGDDLGDEAALDMDEPVDDELPPDPEDEDEVPGTRMYESQEEIVNEVARRVAARLQAENSKQNLADELTEKIFNRLTNKG